MTLNATLKKAGIALSKALPCDNTIPAHIMVLTGEQLLKLFPLEKVSKLGVQRNDAARLGTKKASHIFELNSRPDTQSEFRAVWYHGVLMILDGNHRIRAWHLDPHLVMANVTLKIYEPETEEQVEALYKSIDSRKNVKNSQDELWSVFNYAGLAAGLRSQRMQVGTNLATVMKRFLPGTDIATRGAAAKRKTRALLLADSMFTYLPTKSRQLKVGDVVGGGEILAILELAHSYVEKRQEVEFLYFSRVMHDEFRAYVNYALDGSRTGKAPALAEVFEAYGDEANRRGYKRTGEAVVVARAALLKPMLEKFMTDYIKMAKRFGISAYA